MEVVWEWNDISPGACGDSFIVGSVHLPFFATIIDIRLMLQWLYGVMNRVNEHEKYAITREKFTFVFFAKIRAVILCFLFVPTNRSKWMSMCAKKKVELAFCALSSINFSTEMGPKLDKHVEYKKHNLLLQVAEQLKNTPEIPQKTSKRLQKTDFPCILYGTKNPRKTQNFFFFFSRPGPNWKQYL